MYNSRTFQQRKYDKIYKDSDNNDSVTQPYFD